MKKKKVNPAVSEYYRKLAKRGAAKREKMIIEKALKKIVPKSSTLK